MLLNDCIFFFLKDISLSRTDDTYKYYKYHCESILKFFDSTGCFVVTAPLVRDYLYHLKVRGLSNNTINKRLTILKMLARNYGLDSSILDIHKLPVRQKTFDFLNFHEVKRLLSYTDDLPFVNRLIFRLFLDTGMRLNELVNIDYRNIDFDNCCILLTHTKTNVDRYVFMTSDTCDLLRCYYLTHLSDYHDYRLFPYAKRTIQDWFYKANKVLGFKHFSPHVLRHTYATILVNNDTNLEFIRITMGHSNLNTTKRYLHMNLENFMSIYKEKFHA